MRVQQLPEFLLKADHAVVGFLLCYAEWGKRLRQGTYLALSGLAAKFGGNLNPGLQPGLRYFAPLGLKSAGPKPIPQP